MPWRNSNDYYAFKEDEILRHAPPTSGVYGLFNLRHQIFIGSTSNIQEALLHHLKQLNSRYKRFEPTGFLFEGVPAEWRELRMFELIFEYDPVMKPDKDIGFAQYWRSWLNPDARAFDSAGATNNELPDEHYEVVSAKPERPRGARAASLQRSKITRIASLLGLIILFIGIIRVAPDQSLISDSVSNYVQFFTEALVAVVRRSEAPEARSSNQERIGAQNTAQTSAAPGVAENSQVDLASESAAIVDSAYKPAATVPATVAPKVGAPAPLITEAKIPPPAATEQTALRWTVQALASTYQSDATALIERLKGKSYDAFAVQVTLKGQTWFRVRVGDFGSYREAEALQNILRSKEQLPDAFAVSTAR